MRLRVIGSSSRGNGYALIAENEILLLEAGCKLLDMKKAIDWQIGKVVGCLVSHRHTDHSGYIKDYIKNGIPVYSGKETAMDIDEYGSKRIRILKDKNKEVIGGFSVQPFHLEHDCPCYGFLIFHPEMGRLVFATDTEYVKYRFRNVNHIMIEANYSKEYLDESEENEEKRRHVLYSHMSIEAAADFVGQNKTCALRNVVLMHLSDRNGCPKEFRKKVENIVDCTVWIAEAGGQIELQNIPF